MDLGMLKSGQRVVDRPQSHLHEGVLNLLPEALAQISLSSELFSVKEINFGRTIGETICVVTTDADEVVFAKRPKRFGLTRFVKNRQPDPTESMVVILKKAQDEENTFVLITAFLGSESQPEPWDRNATEKSLEFWSTHALIWGVEETVPGTVTTVKPW